MARFVSFLCVQNSHNLPKKGSARSVIELYFGVNLGTIWLNVLAFLISIIRVRRFRSIFFALAAFVWLPVSAHCQLEVVTGLEFLRCEPESASSHNPSKDCSNCCSVEKSQYRGEQLRLLIPVPELLCSAPVMPVVHSFPVEVSLGILTAAPPELSPSWLFLSRTALPIRAPSIAS